MSGETGMSEGSVSTPVGSFTFKGKQMAEFIAILSLVLLFLLGYVLWEHKNDSQELNLTFTNGFKEMAAAQREQNQIQREQLCLLSLPEDKREKEFLNDSSFCKRLSRER